LGDLCDGFVVIGNEGIILPVIAGIQCIEGQSLILGGATSLGSNAEKSGYE